MSAFADVFGDITCAAYPAELRGVRRATLERRREHATVRACARAALARLGHRPGPILSDADGVPVWPDGVVGSLTHCRGYRAALVSWRSDHRMLGLDAEPHEPLPDDTRGLVLGNDDEHDLTGDWHADRIAFCAKEAAYKAWFPSTRKWLEFTDVSTSVHSDGTFAARADDVPALRGRWTVRRGYVVVAAWVGSC